MESKFKCSSCKKFFDIKELGYFSWSQGHLCKECWKEIKKEQEKNERMYKRQEEKEFENKIRKILDKWWGEKNGKKHKN